VDIEGIRKLIDGTTTVYRVGPALVHNGEAVSGDDFAERFESGQGGVYEVFGYPPAPDAAGDGEEIVDVGFVKVGVRADGSTKTQLVALIGDGVLPESGTTMAEGPSYIHLGADFGSQELALRFMALGAALKCWTVFGPEAIGMTGPMADMMRGQGFLYAIGWQPAGEPAMT